MRIVPITRFLAVLLAAIVSACCSSARATGRWNITNVTLAPKDEHARRFQAFVTDKSTSAAFTISDEVTLTSIDEYFVFKDRLVLLGDAGRAQEIAIFDFSERKKPTGSIVTTRSASQTRY